MDNKKWGFYYGILLVFVGIGVFFRVPEVSLQMETIEFFKNKITVLKGCFYLLGVFLIIAGGMRIYKNY